MRCAACGYSLVRKERGQRFCSDRCSDYAERYPEPIVAAKRRRAPTGKLPFEILGHDYRSPDAKAPDRKLLAKIVWCEIGDRVLP